MGLDKVQAFKDELIFNLYKESYPGLPKLPLGFSVSYYKFLVDLFRPKVESWVSSIRT